MEITGDVLKFLIAYGGFMFAAGGAIVHVFIEYFRMKKERKDR